MHRLDDEWIMDADTFLPGQETFVARSDGMSARNDGRHTLWPGQPAIIPGATRVSLASQNGGRHQAVRTHYTGRGSPPVSSGLITRSAVATGYQAWCSIWFTSTVSPRGLWCGGRCVIAFGYSDPGDRTEPNLSVLTFNWVEVRTPSCDATRRGSLPCSSQFWFRSGGGISDLVCLLFLADSL
jgi:hypothetical protein